MKKKRNIISISIILIILFISQVAWSISLSVKSEQDFIYTIDVIRKLNVIVTNFPEDKAQERFKKIRESFQIATIDFYGQHYTDSYKKFKSVKKDLNILLKDISQSYIKRTKILLDSTSKEAFNVLLNYSKNSPVTKFLRRRYDPFTKEPKPYDVKKFHLFKDKQKIEAYLRLGYKKYHLATKLFSDPELEIIRNKKRIESKTFNYSINKYLKIITECRLSKQYGIEIYKVLYLEKLVERERNYGYSKDNEKPVFDDRIPDQYKIDANDNMNMLHSKEMERLSGFKINTKAKNKKDK